MAERARTPKKSKSGNGVGHNSGGTLGGRAKEEIYRRWLSKIEPADARYERAREEAKSFKGELGAIFAAAKEDGCNIDAIKEARKKHKLDHLTVAQDYDDMGFVLRIMKSPLAEQLSLFAPPERSPEAEAAMRGELAGRQGISADENPHDPGTDLHATWRSNWNKGQAAIVNTMRA